MLVVHPLRASSASPTQADTWAASSSSRAHSGYSAAQPVEQVAVEGGAEGPGQVLVQVVVGVDEPRRHQAVGGVDGAGRAGRLGAGRTHPRHEPAGDRHPAAGDLGALSVH